jgi:hypothetical protein
MPVSGPAIALSVSAAIVAVAAGAAAPPAGTSPPPAVVWTPFEPGAERGAVSGGGARLELFRFDLRRFGAKVFILGAGAPKPRPVHAADIVGGEAVAVANGGFFDEKGAPLGLRISERKVLVPLRRNVDWGVLVVAGKRARIVHTREYAAAPDVDAAIQVGPRILIDGAVPRLKPQVARRTAVALPRDGSSLTLVVAPDPVDAAALGARLAALGFHSALMLDGGPSTQLSVDLGFPPDAGVYDFHADPRRFEIPGGYPVPDLLVIFRR